MLERQSTFEAVKSKATASIANGATIATGASLAIIAAAPSLPKVRKKRSKGSTADAKASSKKKSGYERWKDHGYRIGLHRQPVKVLKQAHGEPAGSLVSWFDAASFIDFASTGTLFGSRQLPTGYETCIDPSGTPWLLHVRTDILVWPVRVQITAQADMGVRTTRSIHASGGGDADVEEGDPCVTLFHYTSRRVMRALTGAVARGLDGVGILEEIETATLPGSGSYKGRGAEGIAATALEPDKFFRHRDLLREVFGPEQRLIEGYLKGASHCIPLFVPYRALAPDGGLERPDRLRILKRRIAQDPRESVRKSMFSCSCGLLAHKATSKTRSAATQRMAGLIAESVQRPGGSMRLSETPSPREKTEEEKALQGNTNPRKLGDDGASSSDEASESEEEGEEQAAQEEEEEEKDNGKE
eukprot:TRINITY_DN19108_c0_g1_i1.p1 TRINITY_DN19108_c0_g1~~TRINITY_DN19108_c0_g1_i1.p1  ORF type:complete len:415 (-),score=80.49 TRINITY_DN19108_c0_g1_i1:142-1386(-)